MFYNIGLRFHKIWKQSKFT